MVDGKSMDVRPQKPAQIHADAKRVAVKLQWNAAAKVKLEIQITDRFVVNTGVESVVADEVRGASRNAGCGETFAVFGRAASIAFGGCSAPENPADHRLIPPGCNVVGRGREAELAGVVFEAAFELSVVAEGDEWAMEKSCVHNRVAYAEVEKRREISEGVVEMVRQIPRCMAGA